MKLLLCFTLGSLAFLVTNSKKIKIQIDSQDLANLFEGVMYSEVLQKIASELVQRSSKKRTLSNPYHPEDELLSNLDNGVGKENIPVKDVIKVPKLDLDHDSLEKHNDEFLNGNDVESDDILTDEDLKPTHELIDIHDIMNITLKSAKNSTLEHIELEKKEVNGSQSIEKVAKKISDNDRVNFKPLKRRFAIVKGSTEKSILKTV